MNIDIDQDRKIRSRCVHLMRRLGVKSFRDYEPHTMPWGELNKHQAEIAREARKLHDSITDKISEDESAEIEDVFDALMGAHDEISGEKDIRTRLGSRDARPYGGDVRRPVGECERHGNDGEFAAPEERFAGLKPEQRVADWISRQGGASEYSALSIGAYLRSMVTGAKTDLEKRALSEGTDSAGGYTVPTILGAQLIDLMRASSVVSQAGAVSMPLTSDSHVIAKLAADPVPVWRLENGAITESEPTFTSVPLTPRSLAVMTKISRELLEDSLNLQIELPRILAAAMAVEWDRVALLGTGTAPQPRGVANTAGIGTAALGGALAGYGPFITARTAIKTANAMPTAIIMHPRDEGALAGLTATDGQPLNPPSQISQIPWLTTTSIPINGGSGTDESTIFMGDFRHMILGVRTEIRIEVVRELFAGNHQYAFIAHMRGDVAVAQPGAFHTTTAVQG